MRFKPIKGQHNKLLDTETGKVVNGVWWSIEERVKEARRLCGCSDCSSFQYAGKNCNMAAAIFEQLPALQAREEIDERQGRLPNT